MNIVDDEEVFLLLDGNISPHDYHLKPSDMKKIKNADIVFYVDDESIETFLHRALNTIDKSNKVSIFSNSRIKLLPIREGGIWEEELAEDGHDHAHGEYDAHIWLSTNNVIKVTKQIVKKLSEITPSKKSIYKKNAVVFIKKLNDNKKEIDEIIIETHEPALRIISNKKDLNNSSDRDHSLEYMVSAALIFKEITSDTYSDNFHGIDEVNALRKKIKVLENKEFTKNYYEISKRHISNEIYFKYKDGSVSYTHLTLPTKRIV